MDKINIKKLILLQFLLQFLNTSNYYVSGANILAVFPSVWKSHYIFGFSILNELSQLNHNITIISAYKNSQQSQNENITEITISKIRENWIEMIKSLDYDDIRDTSIMERFTRLIYAGTSNTDLLLDNKNVKNLLMSDTKFDLLIVDLFLGDALLGLSYFYKIPTVVISPADTNTWLHQATGNPHNSALDPSSFLPYQEKMSFWQRNINTLMSAFEKLTYNFFHMVSQQAVYTKHFSQYLLPGENLPHHRDLVQNISAILLNSHPVTQYPRAYLPNMIEIGGAHINKNINYQNLSKSILNFIEKAKDGVIYVSFGANLRTADLPVNKSSSLLRAFATLNKSMNILLKWENATIIDQPSNVFISDWFPQQQILAHPKVKIFITTGGILSTLEAIHFKTPIIGIPIFSEQESRINRIERLGCGIKLNYDELTEKIISNGINEIMHNNSYNENLKRFSYLIKENLNSPLDKALYYIELVIKTNGADHLKSHAHHLNFFGRELVDVLLLIFFGILIIIAIPYFVIELILKKSDCGYSVSVNDIVKNRKLDNKKLMILPTTPMAFKRNVFKFKDI